MAARALIGKLRQAVRRGIDAVPGLAVLVQAVRNYIVHQSANQAGSVAFSTVLSMFPLLLLIGAAAAYIGEPGTAADLVRKIMQYVPPLVSQALKPVIDEVLSEPNRSVLAIGLVVTIWTASSGMQSVRTALNRAYGIDKGLSFWRARIKVTLFTLVGIAASLAAFSSVVVLPYAWQLVQMLSGDSAELYWLIDVLRYGLAYVVLVFVFAVFYSYLPDTRQSIVGVVPGALLGALLWLLAATTLSYTLRGAGKLELVYGGFTGAVATLVFLYFSAAMLIFGAEINGVLHGRKRAADEGRAQPAH